MKARRIRLQTKQRCSGKFLQGGYEICSDIMLWNMASMDEGEKIYETIVLMVKSNITKEWINPLMRWLQLYILLKD